MAKSIEFCSADSHISTGGGPTGCFGIACHKPGGGLDGASGLRLEAAGGARFECLGAGGGLDRGL